VYIAHVKEACAFLGDGMSRVETMEPTVHGRGRDLTNDEMRLGVVGRASHQSTFQLHVIWFFCGMGTVEVLWEFIGSFCGS